MSWRDVAHVLIMQSSGFKVNPFKCRCTVGYGAAEYLLWTRLEIFFRFLIQDRVTSDIYDQF